MEHFQENQNDLKRMEMLRAALPYIPVSMQKFLSIYIGLEELFNAIRIIREGPVLYMDSLNYQPQKLGNTEELVKVLRGFDFSGTFPWVYHCCRNYFHLRKDSVPVPGWKMFQIKKLHKFHTLLYNLQEPVSFLNLKMKKLILPIL